jgi:hypothetical protein
MDVPLIAAGALFVIWPLQYRWNIGRIRRKLTDRGGDVERFDTAMERPWINAIVKTSPVAGLILIVLGLLG